MFLIILIKVVILLTVWKNSYGQSITYNPNTVPDSQRNWMSCGVREPSFLCDPYRLLNPAEGEEDGALKVHSRLEHLRLATLCPCEGFSNFGECNKINPHGYTISVIVVKTTPVLGGGSTFTSMSNRPKSFSDSLRYRFRERAQCEDDALIVLSVADDIVWTSVGALMAKKLTPNVIDFAAKGACEYFAKHDYTRGLLYIIHEYSKHLLPIEAPNFPSTNANSENTLIAAHPRPFNFPVANENKEDLTAHWEPAPELGISVHLEDEILWPWWNFWPWTQFPPSWASSADNQWLRMIFLFLFLLVLIILLSAFIFSLYKLVRTLIQTLRQHHDGYFVGKFRHSN